MSDDGAVPGAADGGQAPGFEFPCTMEITAIGAADDDIAARVAAVLVALDLSVIAGSERQRPSGKGNFVSVTVGIQCPSRALYERVHAALRADPAVRWTL